MYSPKIKPELVKRLWKLKQKTKRSIVELANEAIELYLEKKKNRRKDASKASEMRSDRR